MLNWSHEYLVMLGYFMLLLSRPSNAAEKWSMLEMEIFLVGKLYSHSHSPRQLFRFVERERPRPAAQTGFSTFVIFDAFGDATCVTH